MKKSPIKELLIGSISAAIAGYVVKKGYEYFRDNELPKLEEEQNSPEDRSLLDKAKGLMNQTVEKAATIKEESPAQQGLIATVAYALTVFTVTKLLRKVI